MKGPTQQLGEFAAALRFGDLPSKVVDSAKLALLNYFACAVAGVDEEVVSRASVAFLPIGCLDSVSLIGQIRRADVPTAAFLNCLASTVLAFDETHARSIVHPVGPVASAALALAEERQLSGEQLLCALVAGIDVASRVSLAVSTPPALGVFGWSQSGVCGAVGAAVACAHLLCVDDNTMVSAMALGANTSAGLRAMNGTMAVSVGVSNASANGLRSALLAAAGVRASNTVLEHPHGFVRLFSETGYLPHLTNEVGRAFAVSELHFKPYPCGVVIHAAIDAAREMRAQLGSKVKEICRIQVRLHPSCLELADRPEVNNEAEASVSVQHWVATALLRDDLGPQCLRDHWIKELGSNKFTRCVELVADSALAQSAADVRVTLTSGTTLHAYVGEPMGSIGRPLTGEHIKAKFSAAARSRFTTEKIQLIIETCGSLETLSNVSALMHQLRLSATEKNS